MTKMSRRAFLAAGGVALAGGLAASTAYLYARDESQDPVVEDVSIPLPRLGPGLEGTTIVQISDFHLYPHTKPPLVRQAVEMANSLRPDLVVLTGDYVWHEAEVIYDLIPILAGLDARLGVYSILGNHEIWTDVNVVKGAFREAGLPILENRGLSIAGGGGDVFYLAGLDDGWSGHPDLDAALEGAPAGAPVVLLYHEPDLADNIAPDGRVALQLSGHSHGGQIRFPHLGPLILPPLGRKYNMGLYRLGHMWLYTNRGLGCTNEPIRYNCAPEVTRLTLVRA
jgi:predicted MPP superfamily phosphohydrolase